MLDTNTISTLEGILNERYPEDKYTIQDGFISQGRNWVGDKPRGDHALVIFKIEFGFANLGYVLDSKGDIHGVCEGCEEDFHLGSAVFVQGGNGREWFLQHRHIDATMGI